MSQRLDGAETAALENNLPAAFDALNAAQDRLSRLSGSEGTTAVVLLRQRIDALRGAINERLTEFWDALMEVDRPEQRITLKHQIQSMYGTNALNPASSSSKIGGSSLDVHEVIGALEKLQLLDSKVDQLYQAIDDIILSPRLGPPVGKTVAALGVKGDEISITGRQGDIDARQLFADLYTITEYLSTRLPPSVAIPLSQTLMPSLTLRLINAWLTPWVPASLDGGPAFRELLDTVQAFVENLESLQWKGTGQLREWVESAPRVWLAKRRTSSLDGVRAVLARGLSDTKTVERVETQKVERDEGIIAAGGDDDWNSNWSDHEGEETGSKEAQAPSENTNDDDDGVEEAWGWGDDEGPAEGSADADALLSSPRKGSKATERRGSTAPKEREMTLREKYTITAIPEAVLGIIRGIVRDAATLSEST